MNDYNSQVMNDFNVARNGTDEQKRQHAIRQIQDPEQRNVLKAMIRYRDRQIKREERRLEQAREGIAQAAIRKGAQVGAAPHLTMKGVVGLTPNQKAAAIRRAVENKYRPIHAAQVTGLRTHLNKAIDKRITSNQRQQAPEQTRPQNSMGDRIMKWRENAQSVARRTAGLNQDQGRSR